MSDEAQQQQTEARHEPAAGIRQKRESGEATKAAAPQEPKFPVERLLGADGPRITGYPVHVVAGALHGNTQTSYTRDQVVAMIEEWLQTPAEVSE